MKNLNIVDTAAEITSNDIKDIEDKFNITFPSPLKTHYLKFNGGRPDVFKLYFVPKNKNPANCNEITINGFYPIKYKNRQTQRTLEEMYTLYINNNEFNPKLFIPFAYDVSGYPLLMNFENLGIYLLNRDEDDDSDDGAMEFIASSLDEFFENLMPPDEYEQYET